MRPCNVQILDSIRADFAELWSRQISGNFRKFSTFFLLHQWLDLVEKRRQTLLFLKIDVDTAENGPNQV